jgi:hypothetical protein
MPRLRERILPESADASSQLRQVINPPKQGAAKGKRLGGRPKGGANLINKYSQAVILEALETFGEDGRGRNGIIGLIHRAVREDVKHAISLLIAITPKLLEHNITKKTEVTFQTIAELDADLRAHGLPESKEIFAISYKNSGPSDDEQLDVVESAGHSPDADSD